MYEQAITIIFTLNALWFGTAFVYFSIFPASAVKLLVPREARESPLNVTIIAAVRFLGGMNLALALLSLLVLIFHQLFVTPGQWAILATVASIAHATQFIFNLPGALRSLRGVVPVWPVLTGPMLFIFSVDALMMIANAALAFVASGRIP